MRRIVRSGVLLAGLALGPIATPAWAQWTRVSAIPARDVFSITVTGDTLAVGQDTLVHVSTDGGATWKPSATVASGIGQVSAIRVHDHRLYAGTDTKGVFVSDDLGDSWLDFNQGLGGLGSFAIQDLLVRGDSLFASTIGGGPWVRNLRSGPWTHIGNTLEVFQAGNMTAIAAGGERLFAAGGFNGTVFHLDPGDPDWTVSLLFNDVFAPGLAGLSAIWTGHRWIVGSNIGVFHSATGDAPWTQIDLGLRPILFFGLAMKGSDVYASPATGGGTLVTMSHDDGITWQNLDTLALVFTYNIAFHAETLYAARVDGLWRRSTEAVDVPPAVPPSRLAFAIVGPRPVGDRVRFAFDLPSPGPVAIDVFDVAGRRVGDAIREFHSVGHGESAWDAADLAPGVYLARIAAAGGRATVRLVRSARR